MRRCRQRRRQVARAVPNRRDKQFYKLHDKIKAILLIEFDRGLRYLQGLFFVDDMCMQWRKDRGVLVLTLNIRLRWCCFAGASCWPLSNASLSESGGISGPRSQKLDVGILHRALYLKAWVTTLHGIMEVWRVITGAWFHTVVTILPVKWTRSDEEPTLPAS